MRTLRRYLRAIFVAHRSLTGVVVLFVACITIALSTGFWLTWRLAYVAMLGVPIAYLWSRFNLRDSISSLTAASTGCSRAAVRGAHHRPQQELARQDLARDRRPERNARSHRASA